MSNYVNTVIRKRKDTNNWQVIFRQKVNSNWIFLGSKGGFKRKIDAKVWANANIDKYKKIDSFEYINLKVSDLKKIYIDYKKKNFRPGTVKNTKLYMGIKTSIDTKKLIDVDMFDRTSLVEDLDDNYNKIKLYKAMFNFAIQYLNMDIVNPLKNYKNNKKENSRAPYILTECEYIKEFRPLLEFPFNVISDCCFYTGARISEIAGITFDCIKSDHIMINKQYDSYQKSFSPIKNNTPRKIPMQPALAESIKFYKSRIKIQSFDGRLFAFEYLPNKFRSHLRCKLKNTKYEGFTPHSFRHSFASRLISEGLDPLTVSYIIGDTIETVLRVYTHKSSLNFQKAKNYLSKNS
ncbi:MAG: tyrosine-type recombinase/integrase [Tissierellia bacterium]|nr:tyrosine-type recombinase/integrase [Tissierellia bacterium]